MNGKEQEAKSYFSLENLQQLASAPVKKNGTEVRLKVLPGGQDDPISSVMIDSDYEELCKRYAAESGGRSDFFANVSGETYADLCIDAENRRRAIFKKLDAEAIEAKKESWFSSLSGSAASKPAAVVEAPVDVHADFYREMSPLEASFFSANDRREESLDALSARQESNRQVMLAGDIVTGAAQSALYNFIENHGNEMVGVTDGLRHLFARRSLRKKLEAYVKAEVSPSFVLTGDSSAYKKASKLADQVLDAMFARSAPLSTCYNAQDAEGKSRLTTYIDDCLFAYAPTPAVKRQEKVAAVQPSLEDRMQLAKDRFAISPFGLFMAKVKQYIPGMQDEKKVDTEILSPAQIADVPLSPQERREYAKEIRSFAKSYRPGSDTVQLTPEENREYARERRSFSTVRGTFAKLAAGAALIAAGFGLLPSGYSPNANQSVGYEPARVELTQVADQEVAAPSGDYSWLRGAPGSMPQAVEEVTPAAQPQSASPAPRHTGPRRHASAPQHYSVRQGNVQEVERHGIDNTTIAELARPRFRNPEYERLVHGALCQSEGIGCADYEARYGFD